MSPRKKGLNIYHENASQAPAMSRDKACLVSTTSTVAAKRHSHSAIFMRGGDKSLVMRVYRTRYTVIGLLYPFTRHGDCRSISMEVVSCFTVSSLTRMSHLISRVNP